MEEEDTTLPPTTKATVCSAISTGANFIQQGGFVYTLFYSTLYFIELLLVEDVVLTVFLLLLSLYSRIQPLKVYSVFLCFSFSLLLFICKSFSLGKNGSFIFFFAGPPKIQCQRTYRTDRYGGHDTVKA